MSISADRYSDGGSLSTTYEVDLLGRTIKRTSPGGVSSYTTRLLNTFTARPGIYYYSMVSLPFQVGSSPNTFDGPVSMSWMNAAGASLGTSEFTLSTSAAYDPDDRVFTLEPTTPGHGEIARSVRTLNPVGQTDSTTMWHDVAGDRSYSTEFEYDTRGRLSYTTAPTGTITRQTYDVLNRVVEIEVGTNISSNMTTVAEYFYDSSQTTTPGVGDGNVTFVRQHPSDSALGPSTRDTKRTFDYRNRLEIVENPASPHQFLEYDNLDRVTRRALFSSVPTAIDTTLADRGI
ncbi:MAG: hypothetical protein AB7O77_15955, partial [Phycisphaerales bacterium]